MQDTFAKEGLQYTMDGKTGSTINSHRLIYLAGQQSTEKQDKLVEALFKAYFTQVRPSAAGLSSRQCTPPGSVHRGADGAVMMVQPAAALATLHRHAHRVHLV